MLHLMKHVYVKPEEENYKHILREEKFQQWNQFRQSREDVSWTWNQSYNETFNSCCAGGVILM